MYIDSHCHLTKKDYLEIDDIIEELNGNLAITSGYDAESNEQIIELCNKYNNIFGTLGIHPGEIDEDIDKALDYIEKNINDHNIVAVGEIGLDYYYEHDKEKQKEIFIKQLDLARTYNKPVVIHSRDAAEDTYEILKSYKDLKVVIHCYSYSVEYALLFVKLGFMLGIGGVVTFKNSRVLKEVVKTISLDNLLIETDSPWLTPEPNRGLKNKPSNVLLVANKIAEIKEIDVKEVVDKTTKNAIKQFDLNI